MLSFYKKINYYALIILVFFSKWKGPCQRSIELSELPHVSSDQMPQWTLPIDRLSFEDGEQLDETWWEKWLQERWGSSGVKGLRSSILSTSSLYNYIIIFFFTINLLLFLYILFTQFINKFIKFLFFQFFHFINLSLNRNLSSLNCPKRKSTESSLLSVSKSRTERRASQQTSYQIMEFHNFEEIYLTFHMYNMRAWGNVLNCVNVSTMKTKNSKK